MEHVKNKRIKTFLNWENIKTAFKSNIWQDYKFWEQVEKLEELKHKVLWLFF